ncbi:MAG: InlB B-repeat-containing protein [Atopobiaceae bacterium]|nr:InlB B-repeat-containing protein [Atopobiaceae bacterium]
MRRVRKAFLVLVGLLLLLALPPFSSTALAEESPYQTSDGETYDDFYGAVWNVPANGTITLLKDNTGMCWLERDDANFTVDLNGHTLSVGSGYNKFGIHCVKGTVTFKNGTIVSNTNNTDPIRCEGAGGTIILGQNLKVEARTSAILASGGGKVIVDGAEVVCSSSVYNAVLSKDAGSSFELRSGSVTQTYTGFMTGTPPATLAVTGGASATVSGGSLYSDKSSALVARDFGSLITVSGGTVKNDGKKGRRSGTIGYWVGEATDGGKIVQTGGEVFSTYGNGLVALGASMGGSIEVSGGTLGVGTTGYALLSRGNAEAGSTATVTGGELTGKVGVGAGSNDGGTSLLTIKNGRVVGTVSRVAGGIAVSGGVFAEGIHDAYLVQGVIKVSTHNQDYPDEVRVIRPWDVNVLVFPDEWAYTGNPITPLVLVSDKTSEETIPEENYELTFEHNVDVGTAAVLVTCTQGDEAGAAATATFTIIKADTNPYVRATRPAYTGKPQALVTGSVQGGELQYSLDDRSYSADVPTATDAGSYMVYYRVVGDKNHNDYGPVSMAASIEKAFIPTPGGKILTIEDWSYGDAPNKPVLLEGCNPGGGEVKFSYNPYGYPEEAQAEPPTVPGIYVVSASVSETKNYWSLTTDAIFNVTARAVTLTAADQTVSYGESIRTDDSAYSLVRSSGEGDALVAGDVATVTLAPSTTDVTDSGTITPSVTIMHGDTDVTAYYDVTAVAGKLTVTKVAPTVVPPKALEGLVYNCAPQVLVEAGAATGGELQYSLDGKNFSAELPAATNAGSYTVWYRVVGDGNHRDLAPATLTAGIGRAPLIVRANDVTIAYGDEPAYAGVTFDGPVADEDAAAELAASVTLETDYPVHGNAGTYRIIPSGLVSANHDATYQDGVLTVVPRAIDPVVELDGWTYGKTARLPVLAAGSNPGGGEVSFEYRAGSLEQLEEDGAWSADVPTQAGSYVVRATIAPTTNYLGGVAYAEFAIEQARITITADDKSTSVYSGQAYLTYQVSGDYVAGDDLGVTLSVDLDGPALGAYPIEVSWNENPNYQAQLRRGIYTITDARISVSAEGYSGTYDGKPHGITVDVSSDDEAFDGTISYATEPLDADNYEEVGSYEPVMRTDVGVTTVYYLVMSYTDEYVSGSKDICIAKAPIPEDADRPTAIEGLVYTGESQVLVRPPEQLADGVERVLYRTCATGGQWSEWSEELPAGTDLGDYTVRYRFVGDKNHEDLDGGALYVTIAEFRTYTVTFDSRGGSEVASQQVREGEPAVRPADPTLDGYAFEGWFVDEALTQAYDFSTPVTASLTLHAAWRELPFATVAATVALEPQTALVVYVRDLLDAEHPELYHVTCTYQGETAVDSTIGVLVESSGASYSDERGYRIVVTDVWPSRFVEPAHVTVEYLGKEDGPVIVADFDYSVRDHCEGLAAEHADDAALVGLCQGMCDFGASAQVMFGYKTDDLANTRLTAGVDAIRSTVVPAAYASRAQGSCTGITRLNKTLDLTSTTTLRFYLYPAAGASKDGYTFTLDGSEVSSYVSQGRWLLVYPFIRVGDLGNEHTVVATNKADGTTVTLTCSALSYACDFQAIDDVTVTDLCKTIYRYYAAYEGWHGNE